MYGTDEDCHTGITGDICIEYFCCDETTGNMCESKVTIRLDGVPENSGIQGMGNFGAGNFPLFAVTSTGRKCTDKVIGSEISTCWTIAGARKNGKKFIERGPGRAPDKFLIPDDVDPNSIVLVEDGVLIPRRHYQVLHDSIAKKFNVPRTMVQKGSKHGKCKKCKKGSKKSLF